MDLIPRNPKFDLGFVNKVHFSSIRHPKVFFERVSRFYVLELEKMLRPETEPASLTGPEIPVAIEM